MYQRKTPKSQQPYKSDYIGHNPHTISLSKQKWPDRIRIISIDPGVTHYAIRVEERNIKRNDVIKTLHFDKVGLKKDEQLLTDDNLCPVYSFIENYLDKYLDLFKTCHVVIIEKQLPVNYKAVRMSQHTLTYFMIHLKNISPTLPLIFEIKPQLKGRELGVPPNLNERGLKLWAVEKARELLMDRSDYEGLEVLDRKDPLTKRKEKKDDLSDTVCQIEAFCSIFSWPLTEQTIELKIPSLKYPLQIVSSQEVPQPLTKTKNSMMKLNIIG